MQASGEKFDRKLQEIHESAVKHLILPSFCGHHILPNRENILGEKEHLAR